MANIIELSPHVADLIAAGEVVERPGSVVKELLENSIDAGATAATVEIQNGGMSFIRVTDNGSGILPEDTETAFLRHATSKIRDESDLAAIGTLGFRGEALAAIAAVSKIELLTRARGEETGISLTLEGGGVFEKDVAGCPDGTTIVVRDLFFNTPARLKFMKRDSAEGANVFGVVQRQALSHPEVSVKFIRDGKEELHTPGDGKLLSAVYSVYGREYALNMLEVNGSWGTVGVSGYVTKPVAGRGNRNYQHFFVNGRYVKSKTMTAALEEAYQNRMMSGRYPGCVLHVEIGYDEVDVNVHPAKTEVKFLKTGEIFDGIYHVVLAAMEEEPGRPETVFQPEKKKDGPAILTSERNLAETPPIQAHTAEAKPESKGFRTGIFGVSSELPQEPLQVSDYMRPAFRAEYLHIELPKEDVIKPQPDTEQLALENQEPVWRVIGEALDTYIIVEEQDGLLLIDKHAAHERVLFERLRVEGAETMSQTLISPVVTNLDREEAAVIIENTELLQELGFGLSDLGGGSILIRQSPADLLAEDIEPTLSQLAAQLMELGRTGREEVLDNLRHTVACKAAVKGGSRSGMPELLELVSQVMTRPDIKYCPHGRPVSISMSRANLEKQFKRK